MSRRVPFQARRHPGCASLTRATVLSDALMLPCGSGPCPRTSVSRARSPAGRLPQALRSLARAHRLSPVVPHLKRDPVTFEFAWAGSRFGEGHTGRNLALSQALGDGEQRTAPGALRLPGLRTSKSLGPGSEAGATRMRRSIIDDAHHSKTLRRSCHLSKTCSFNGDSTRSEAISRPHRMVPRGRA